MKIIVAPDAFKGSMMQQQVAKAMIKGIRRASPNSQVVSIPLADGGEGTADVLIEQLQAQRMIKKVTGPLGEKVTATYGITTDDVAIIDVASAIGMHHVPIEKRNPLQTSTFGVGELIRDALNRGATKFIIGLGGSSTNDCGIGMLQALGAIITDEKGDPVSFGGEGLANVDKISLDEIDPRIKTSAFTVAADVTNPLLGKQGATYVYGPQKGAPPEMLPVLEQAMTRFATLLEKTVEHSLADIPGAGAAGGLGTAFMALTNKNIERGIDVVIRHTNLEAELKDATFVLTGEGKIDDQTGYGKVPYGVAQLAKKYHVPVIALTGVNDLTNDILYEAGVTAVFSITQKPLTVKEAMERGEVLIEKTVENVVRLWQAR